MFLYRPVKLSDLNQIFCLAAGASSGLTNFPADEKVLRAKIRRSIQSFKKNSNKPQNELYFFVLEDLSKNCIAGVSAIEANAGHDVPFFSYKLGFITRISRELNIRNDYQLLHLVNDFQGKSEICTLYLAAKYRGANIGKALSRFRFLYMANNPQQFTEIIFAEMRGKVDKKGEPPFWKALGKRFFNMEFHEADRLSATTNKQFILDLMPRNPIYLHLLNQQAVHAIGKPHNSTKPALRMLEKEGFLFDGYVDIFDAGPTVSVPKKLIKTVANSIVTNIIDCVNDLDTDLHMVATVDGPFRATLAPAIIYDGEVILSKEHAQLLKLKPGKRCRIIAY